MSDTTAALLTVMQMICPCCAKTQYIKLNFHAVGARLSSTRVTKCWHCGQFLFVVPKLQSAPNTITLELKIESLPEEAAKFLAPFVEGLRAEKVQPMIAAEIFENVDPRRDAIESGTENVMDLTGKQAI